MSGQWAKLLRRRLADESGVMTAFGLFTFITMLMISAFAIDYSNAVRAQTRLQVNADATAHAALLSREFGTVDAATSAALTVAYQNMPKSTYGDIVDASDIVFGTWDAATRTFTPDSSSRDAVRVTMHQNTQTGNPVGTFLFRLVGLDYWNINRMAIFTTYDKACTTEGFVAEHEVDIQSNNQYLNGFCIHSNDILSINSNNYFEEGTQVTMPDPSTIQLPNSGFSTDTGLEQALRKDSWHIRILDELDTVMSGLAGGDARYTPSYITNTVPVPYTQGKIGTGDLASGNIYNANCSSNSPLNISSGTVISNVVLVTNCLINFGSNVQLHNVVIADTNSDSKAITGASGLEVGLNDNCASGGGAQIITNGGMNFPSAMKLYGGQLIAKGDVNFSANGDGVQGASVISGGTISGTSNMTMAYCGSGMEQDFQAAYFHMVQ